MYLYSIHSIPNKLHNIISFLRIVFKDVIEYSKMTLLMGNIKWNVQLISWSYWYILHTCLIKTDLNIKLKYHRCWKYHLQGLLLFLSLESFKSSLNFLKIDSGCLLCAGGGAETKIRHHRSTTTFWVGPLSEIVNIYCNYKRTRYYCSNWTFNVYHIITCTYSPHNPLKRSVKMYTDTGTIHLG